MPSTLASLAAPEGARPTWERPGVGRPSFTAAAPPEAARALYDTVLRLARERHADVAAGVFGASMQVELVNDGPVTIPLDVR